MYTAAGFVALGGFGAVWSARPPLVDQVQASQHSGPTVDRALERDVPRTPGWAQRLGDNLNNQLRPAKLHKESPTDNTRPAASADKPAAETPAAPAAGSQTNAATPGSQGLVVQQIATGQQALTPPWSQPITIAPSVTAATAASAATAPAQDTKATAQQVAAANQAPAGQPMAATDHLRDDRAELPSLSIEELTSAFNLGGRPVADDRWVNNGDRQANRGIQRTISVRRGDTLFGVLVDAGVGQNEAQDAVGALSDVFSPRALRVGQEITLSLNNPGASDGNDDAPTLVGLSFEPSVTQDVTLKRSESGDFVAKSVDKPLQQKLSRVSGTIDSSLFEAAREAGLPVAVVGDVIKTLSYNVDFQRDIHSGDSFEVLYERYENGEGAFAKAGKMLYAAITLGGKKIPLYYFEHDGDGEFFTALGESVRKSLLRTPIDGAKITSGFGMRMHPLLGYTRMHKGVDFGAPTGTPIFAAGNGVVVEIGQKNGYGNYVRIKHNGTYSTAYAHCSRFAVGLHKGDRVKQGEVIAYVGATGQATGPHLHYEVLINNEQVNPATVKMADADKLTGKDLAAFKAQVNKIEAELNKQRRNTFIAETPGRSIDCTGPDGCEN